MKTTIRIIAVLLCITNMAFAQEPSSWRVLSRDGNGTPTIIIPEGKLMLHKSTGIQTQSIGAELDGAVNTQANAIATELIGLPKSATLSLRNKFVVGTKTNYFYTASYSNIPVSEQTLRITIGNITHTLAGVTNSITSFIPNATVATKSVTDVGSIIDRYVGSNATITVAPKLVYVVDNDQKLLRLAYQTTVSDRTKEPFALTIDAQSGEMIEMRSLIVYHSHDEALANPKARVSARLQLKTPFDTLTTVSLSHLFYNAQLKTTDSVGIFPLIGSFPQSLTMKLSGDYCAVTNLAGANASADISLKGLGLDEILFDDSNSDIAERDAYYSVIRVHDYIERLDPTLFSSTGDFLQVNVNSDQGTCNAFYNPQDISVNFYSAGGGCSNTAQIADVVYHEFGHHVQHLIYGLVNQDPTINITNGSLGEGFADVISAFMRDDSRIGINFFGNSTQLLRNCLNTKKWPTNISTSDPHVNGEIIAGALWDLRVAIGLPTATTLFHNMLYHTPDYNANLTSESLRQAYLSTLFATLLADDTDADFSNGTPHQQEIVTAFAKHNIGLTGFINASVERLSNQDSSVASYTVHSSIVYSSELPGAVDKNNVVLAYSIDKGKTYKRVVAQATGNNFTAVIPKQKSGTIVYYHIITKLTISTDSLISPAVDNVFLVGYKSLFSDSFESSSGWTRATTDNAAQGMWVLGKPTGTAYSVDVDPVDFIQQDTDHSEIGTKCYITGNSAQAALNPFLDCVSNGTTTLISPAINLSQTTDPIVRFWYHYSNEKGFLLSPAKFTVRFSSNGGLNWTTATQTAKPSNGWVSSLIRVKDIITAGVSSLKVAFIATNSTDYAVVEAGVDDFEVLDAIPALVTSVATANTSTVNTLPYPNPVAPGSTIALDREHSSLELYDLSGKKITTGNNAYLLIPESLSAGVYVLRSIGNDVETFKVVVSGK